MMLEHMQAALKAAESHNLRRCLRVQGDKESLKVFASNDYLGLRREPRVIEAFTLGLRKYGTGSGASPLITGYSDAHNALAEDLADWLGAERVLLFSSGFAANQGVLTTLGSIGVVPVLDRLCHASIYDGVPTSHVYRFRHLDYTHADFTLQNLPLKSDQSAMLVSEGVFSMDGDQVCVGSLKAVANKHKVPVMLDDAHGLGVTGEQGRGVMGSIDTRPDILTGTFGKAFGVAGAFVATNQTIADFLVQRCRHFIYSTAFPAAQALAIHASLDCIRTQPERRTQLSSNIAYFKQCAKQLGLRLARSETPIQPLIIGLPEYAINLANLLRAGGFECTAIRYPTVPKNSSRIRFTLSSAHTPDDIDALFSTLNTIFRTEPELREACTYP